MKYRVDYICDTTIQLIKTVGYTLVFWHSYGKITMFNRGIELDEPWLPYLSSIANP